MVSSALNKRDPSTRGERLFLRGMISDTSLADLLQTVESSGRTVEVRLVTEFGEGSIWFRRGRPIDAELDSLTGEAALSRLITSQDGRFEVREVPSERPSRLNSTVAQSYQALLARRRRWRELIQRAPVLNLVMEPVAPETPAGEKLARRHRALLEHFDGSRCVLDVIEETGRDAIAVAEEIVELWESRLLQKVGSLSQPPPAEVTQLDDIPKAPRVPQFGASTLRHEVEAKRDSSPRPPDGRYSSRPNQVEAVFRRSLSSAPDPAAFQAQAQTLTELEHEWANSPELEPGTVRGGTPNVFSATQERGASGSTQPQRRLESPTPLAATGPAAASPGPSPRASDPSAAEPGRERTAGRFLGRYEVLCRIARGGMGTVYLCRVTKEAGFRRLFALKVLRQRLREGETAANLFLQEAYIASRLHHPNVVAVVDAAVHEGQPYLVMDYVDGCSLRILLDRTGGPRPVTLVLAIVMDALAGLQAAHELTNDDGSPARVVHADVSPDNLLVGVDGSCRISDFGVAHMRNPSEARFSDSANRGKAAYVSPEQALGQKLDPRADVFAMGAVLFTGITGRPPFEGATVEETLRNVVRGRVPAPSTLGPHGLACLDAVCLKALEKDPAQRFANAAEMRAELLRVAAREGLLAAPGEVGAWVKQVFGAELQSRRLAILDAARAPVKALPKSLPSLPVDGAGLEEERENSGTGAESDEAGPGVLSVESDQPPSAPGTVLLPRVSRARNAVLIASAGFAMAVILASLLYPSVVGRWFSLDLGTLPLPPPDPPVPAERQELTDPELPRIYERSVGEQAAPSSSNEFGSGALVPRTGASGKRKPITGEQP